MSAHLHQPASLQQSLAQPPQRAGAPGVRMFAIPLAKLNPRLAARAAEGVQDARPQSTPQDRERSRRSFRTPYEQEGSRSTKTPARSWSRGSASIGNETQYRRQWRKVTIEGVGDQGDRTEYEPDHKWVMGGSGLRGYLEYTAGELTPFEESIVSGDFTFEEGFTPVNVAGQMAYYTVSGGSGDRHHRIYRRDGSIAQSWHTEAALINEGIGPLVFLLPGVRPALKQGGAAVVRGGLNLGRKLLAPAKRALQKGAITTRLAIGRAEAGAVATAPTALGGFTSRNAVTLVEGRARTASVVGSGRAAVQAGEAVTAPSAVSAQTATQSATTVAATESTAASGVTTPGTGVATAIPAADAIVNMTGVPEAIDAEASGQVTNRITAAGSNFGAAVGEYLVFGEKGLEGDAFVREIHGLRRPAGKTTDIRPIVQMFNLMMAEARAAGATELRITGRAVTNQNVMRLRRFIERRGGTVTTIDERTTQLVIPL